VENLNEMGIKIISFADTIGSAESGLISDLYQVNARAFPEIEFGLHLHTHPKDLNEKIEAALQAGCKRFDGAIHGFGGCPMAKDELVGNVATELLIGILERKGYETGIDKGELGEAIKLSKVVFD
jgi:hydroxymethylglutaryl-CoA lyase